MATMTQHAPGTFCWPELATTDQDAAKAFYGGLFGWTMMDNDMGADGVYTMMMHGGNVVGALYTLRADASTPQATPPHWGSYVSVDSADAAAARAKTLGATVMVEPFDVGEHGRMAVLRDPQGGVFSVWEAKAHIGATVLDEVGSLCWTELMARDPKAAEAFYTGLLPWTTADMPMGPDKTYTLFKRGTVNAGGMMQITPDMGPMPSCWVPYFQVADCDAAVAKATGLGARTMVPPQDIPGTGRFAWLADPQGATFAVIKLNQP